MTIAVTSRGSGLSGEGVSSFAMTSFTLPANRLGLIWVFQAGGGPPSNVPTISGWTQHATYEHSDIRRVTLFRRVVGTDTTEGPTIDCGGQTQSAISYHACNLDEFCVITGTAGADGIVQVVSHGNIHAPSVNATPTLTALAAFSNANNATMSAINIGYQANAASVGTGFTEVNRTGVQSFGNMGSILQFKSTNDTVHELTGCTNSEDMFIGMAIELNHVATGGGTPQNSFLVII
jgi:hypothetical protein